MNCQQAQLFLFILYNCIKLFKKNYFQAECAVTEYTDWSECSVTCGKGLRMRTREYRMPEKAQMFSCNRQLVSKEMCVAAVPECSGESVVEDSQEKVEDNEGICKTTLWTEWSECSETCGIGVKSRTRGFVDPAGRKKCQHIITCILLI